MTVRFADFVDSHNPVIVKPSRRFGLPTKSLHFAGICERTFAENLDRHFAIQTMLSRAINNPSPTAPDFFEQIIVAQSA
jgi:hypothetical protein